jgi:hypothetical protein
MAPPTRSRVFHCPRCKASYWGGRGEQLPDCPHCGYDHRRREGFRFDLLFLMVLIIAMIGFMLLTSTYKGSGSWSSKAIQEGAGEKLPGR